MRLRSVITLLSLVAAACLAADDPAPTPFPWILPPASPPQVHIAKGLWWDYFGLDEAMAQLGATRVTSSHHCMGRQGRTLRRYPGSRVALARHNLVMIVNVEAPSIRERNMRHLREFVENGGSLFLFGGLYAFGRGGYAGTDLDAILPCEAEPKDRSHETNGLVLKPTSAARRVLPRDLAWEMAPRAYCYHRVKPREGAQVLVTAGDVPILMTWKVGRGAVAAFVATVEGDPPVDQLGFWEWGDLPRLVASVSSALLSESDPRLDVRALGPVDTSPLDDLDLPDPGNEDVKRTAAIRGILAHCNGPSLARDIVRAVGSLYGTPSRDFVDQVVRAVRPFADAELAGESRVLLGSSDPGKADLAARLIGMGRPEGGGEVLRRLLAMGTSALGAGDSSESLLEGGLPMSPGLVGNERVKLGAVIAMGDLGDVSCIPRLQRASRDFGRARQLLFDLTETSDIREEIYQRSLISRCKLGDVSAAKPLFGVIDRTVWDIVDFKNGLDIMYATRKKNERLERCRKVSRVRFPGLYRRAELQAAVLGELPYDVTTKLIPLLAPRREPFLLPYGMAAFSPTPGRTPDASVGALMVPLLHDGATPGLRMLGFRLAWDVDDPALRGRVVSVLTELAGGADVAGACFALRRLPELPQAARRAIVDAALGHGDERVQRLAGLSAPRLRTGRCPARSRSCVAPSTTAHEDVRPP